MNSHEEKLVKDFLLSFENQKESQLDLSWIIPPLILSRKLFKNQTDTRKFTTEILGIEYRDYVYKSRPLLVGKIMKDIMKMDSTISLATLNNLILFIETLSNSNNVSLENTDIKDKDSFFSEWSRFLNKTDNPTTK